jgi:hypothetical protein
MAHIPASPRDSADPVTATRGRQPLPRVSARLGWSCPPSWTIPRTGARSPDAGLLLAVHSSGSRTTPTMTLVTAPAAGGVPSRLANNWCPFPISVRASVSASAAMRPSSRSVVMSGWSPSAHRSSPPSSPRRTTASPDSQHPTTARQRDPETGHRLAPNTPRKQRALLVLPEPTKNRLICKRPICAIGLSTGRPESAI